MTNQSTISSIQRTGAKADVYLTLGVVVLMVFALITTFDWPAEAAMFPRIVVVLGLVFSGGFGISLFWNWRRSRTREGLEVAHSNDDGEKTGEERGDDAEYVFATADRRTWQNALIWVVSFLALTGTLGLFISSGVFALLYLRFSANRTWRFSLTYAAVLSLFLLAMFRWILYVPTPIGVISGF